MHTATRWSELLYSSHRAAGITDFFSVMRSCFRGRDRTHKGHLQPKTRLHTPNKVIKVIVLIFLIPLPPDMLIEKPVGIRQKRARVNDGEEGEKDSVGGEGE